MFENGKMWADDVGKPIQAHGGCIIQHDGMWYWYGEHKGAKNCPGTTRVDVIGISCYSSKDMNSWRYEGLALDVKDSPKGSLIQPENVCERPKVLYNKKNRKICHVDASGHSELYLCGSSGSRSRPSNRSVYRDPGNAAEPDGQQGHDTF